MTDNQFSLSEESLQKIEELRKNFPDGNQLSLVIPALWIVQDEHGYVPEEAVDYLARLLPVPAILVKEALSWYSMFRKEKTGKYHIQVCRNLSCCLRGGESLLGYISKKLGIGPGETTPDGKFTLSTVECLASCGTAPVVQIDKTYYEDMTEEKLDQILAKLK